MNKINFLIDFNNLMIRILFTPDVYEEIKNDIKNNKKYNFIFFRHVFFRSINSFLKQSLNKEISQKLDSNIIERNIILAVDSKSWRKSIYESYKENRNRTKTDEEIKLWEMFYEFFYEFLNEIEENFKHWFIIKSDMSEADDVISVLVQEVLKNEINVVISNDKDFLQLLNLDIENLYIYNPSSDILYKEIDNDFLLKMIIMGDKADNIPPIKRGIGIKRAEKIIFENCLDKLINEDIEVKKQFNINKKIISLDIKEIPDFVIKGVINAYKHYNIQKSNQLNIYKYLCKFYKNTDELNLLI